MNNFACHRFAGLNAWVYGLVLLGAGAWAPAGTAAPLSASTCNAGAANPPACNPAVVRGDRAEGWLAQGRAEVMARNGIVTTSQPLAAEAGLKILRDGGNAIDAAVAAAATLNVVEPMNVGMAGDLFAILYIAKEHKIHVLNASGKAPSGLSLAFMNANGYRWNPKDWGPGSGMPWNGILTVTVPGAAWGWQEVLDKYGTMHFKEVLQPAIDYATQGFPVSQRIAYEWELPKAENSPRNSLPGCCTALDPDSVKAWYIDGAPPKAGQIFRNPDLAQAFKLLQKEGRSAFYTGAIAQAIVAKSRALGGTMTLQDLANYRGEWVDPVAASYHGFLLNELPPPSQGFAANEMLNILQECIGAVYPGKTLASLGPADPRYWHLLVEAKKLAYADLYHYNGDPDFNPGLLSLVKTKLLTAAYARSLCPKISPTRASQPVTGNATGNGDTVVLSTADRWGNMVAWVNSNYDSFGSGITVPGYGFVLHNRGGLFTLDPHSPNVIAPQKRPYNTLSAGFAMQDGRTDGQLLTVLLMGGDMQAQGHAQMMVNMVDLGANLQASTDMARFYHNQVPNKLELESQLYGLVGAGLKAMGHDVVSATGENLGGYQAILFTPDQGEKAVQFPDSSRPVNGFYRAGSDHRKDGEAVGW
ncbi:MAG: gamma-glutamyltransferase family protein [Steroidobacteraceae bacterium]